MNLIQKLEREARLLDLAAKESVASGSYRQEHRDLANLLLEAAKRIHELEQPRTNRRVRGVDHGYRNFW